MALIHIENKIDVAEFAKVLANEHQETAREILTIIKGHCDAYTTFLNVPGIQQILDLYNINHQTIR